MELSQPLHLLPRGTVLLGPSAQGPPKQTLDRVDKSSEVPETPRYRVVVESAPKDLAQPPGVLMLVYMPPPAERRPDALDRARHPLSGGLASQPELAPPGHRAIGRPAQKSNVSGFPKPRFRRSTAAWRPNSISRVLAGCNSNPNGASRCFSAARYDSASLRY